MEIPVSVYYPFNFLREKFFNSEKLGKKIRNRFKGGRVLSLNPKFEEDFNIKFINYEIKNNRQVINLMLHSSELAINCSPFTNNLTNYNKVWKILENSFKFIQKNKIESLTLTKASEVIKEKYLA